MVKIAFVFIFMAVTLMPGTSHAYCTEQYHLNGAKSAISAVVESIYCSSIRPSVEGMRNILKNLQQYQMTLTSSSCPRGWNAVYRSCFKVINKATTWQKGQTICNNHGGALAVIKNDAESEYVLNLVHRVSGKHVTAWIGYNDRKRNNYWVWNGDTRDRYGGRWYPRHPDYRRTRYNNCAYLGPGTSRWKDSPCNNRRIVVCYKAKK